MEYTKISVNRDVNKRITLICARLGLKKTKFLDKISRTPQSKLQEIFKEVK